jgi:hypothetical protein
VLNIAKKNNLTIDYQSIVKDNNLTMSWFVARVVCTFDGCCLIKKWEYVFGRLSFVSSKVSDAGIKNGVLSLCIYSLL